MFFDRLTGSGHVCAHRGARAHAPENTLLGARLGLDAGADFWEMDVHLVADGSLAVFHDDTLARTTDVASRPEFADRAPWPTHAFTLPELRTLDAGSWFADTDPYGTIASGAVTPQDTRGMRQIRIPSLRQALAFTSENDFPVNLEIKDQLQSPGDLTIVHKVLDLLRETRTESLVLLSSFNHNYLSEMHRLAPDLPLAALVEEKHPDNLMEYLKRIGCSGYHPDAVITDSALVERLSAEGFRVSPYTVNDMDRAQALVMAGCFSVITDYPARLRRRLAR